MTRAEEKLWRQVRPVLKRLADQVFRAPVVVVDAEGRLKRIAEIIEGVDQRAQAADGPVTPTLQEMTQAEMSEIYALAARTA